MKNKKPKTRNPIAETEQKMTGSRAGAHKNRSRAIEKGHLRKYKHKKQWKDMQE